MRELTGVRGLVAVLLAVAAAIVPGRAGAGPQACPVPNFIPGTQLVTGAPGQWIKVSFRVSSPLSATFWGESALRAATTATTGPGFGFAAERAMAATFFNDANGNTLNRDGALVMYPYGIQIDADSTYRVAAQDGICFAVAGGVGLTLAPGDYEMVVLAVTETGQAGGAALPNAVQVTAVRRGPLARVSESDLVCDVKLRAAALGASSQTLVGCRKSYATTGTAYRALGVGRAPDAAHQVRWRRPDATSTSDVVFFDLARGGPGTWTVDVPRYITPAGHPFGLPIPQPGALSSDSGIFGAIAGVT